MNLLYRFESSTNVISLPVDTKKNDTSKVVSIILKSIFKEKEPMCSLELIGSKDTILLSDNTIPYVFKRKYRNNFVKHPSAKEVRKPKRKRRWKSREKRVRRWRSRSPTKNYRYW